MGAQRRAVRVLGIELLHQLGPQIAGGAQLRDLHEEVHADGPEEAEPRRELVDLQSLRQGGAHIFEAVRQREGELLHRGRAGFLHVVAGDRDRVELRHALRRVGDDVGDDAHRGRGRIDVGVPHHELFEDVVLDGAGEQLLLHALLFARDDEAGQHRQHRAVHGHRHAHLVERDAVEQDLHVLDGIDRHAGLADVADHARVIGIVAAVGGEVEGDGEPLLPLPQVVAIEGVGILGGGKAGILPDGPGPVGIHGGARAAGEGRQAGQAAGDLDPFQVVGGVERLDRDAFRRRPGQGRGIGAFQLLGRQLFPILPLMVREIGQTRPFRSAATALGL